MDIVSTFCYNSKVLKPRVHGIFMNIFKPYPRSILGLVVTWGLIGYPLSFPTASSGSSTQTQAIENQEENKKILIELFLAPDQKKNIENIKTELNSLSIRRINVQFFRLGHPPQNIAIGRNVSASAARVAIQLANHYNGGIKYLLAEYRFPSDYIAIGTSAFDEASQIPVLPEDIERLANPKLSTSEFHALYRSLTKEEKGSATDY
jgi:hypothetical protein